MLRVRLFGRHCGLFVFLLPCFLVLSNGLQASGHDWHKGTLLSAERQEQDTTYKEDKTKYSKDAKGNVQADRSTTTSTIPNTIYMIYKISDGQRTYEARQGTTVWQTKVKAQPGDTIQFAVEGESLYVKRDDGKESKMKVLKVAVAGQP